MPCGFNRSFSGGGCCVSINQSPEATEQLKRSRMIDKMIAKDKKTNSKQVKLLLLGAGESGKSTFLKQMKIIHGYHFEEESLAEYKLIIFQNMVKGMKVLVDACKKLNIEWGTEGSEYFARHVFAFDNNVILDARKFLEYAPSIFNLWRDVGIQSAFNRRAEFQISDGLKYLYDNLDRIANLDYVPTVQDILYARKATKAITEYSVTINSVPFLFVDVGGQRSQRQKWFQCFDSVTSILFLVSSSEYDQVLLEDRITNRLSESLEIYENVVNNRCFQEVSFILFLNKTDLLKGKLEELKRLKQDESSETVNHSTEPVIQDSGLDRNRHLSTKTLADYFPDFAGDPLELEDVQSFLVHKFDTMRQEHRRQMYHHFTTAVDTENIKYVFNAVRNTILQKNITQLMLQ